ncbi:AraC family transcriptional regulator [Xanthomonas phaseoli]|uniref:AraC family transcriptional regulator n=1 Tax=Xanthomonas phaseoli TaxID=1985254 RepID=UPI001AD9662C|nr:AraC family transcriptional regulator [Xanthomonas phaseoli]MBO9853890.1 AraC family transcriptional regulator [Xanthomonas phaseoli pv. dieffenbachiae]MBO9968266.1 AraC family transcriptional regulator [Xanthomonas phaseoli pv. dieffenbachiae]MBO9987028.1 AraC family transcriptional regulator [Xanthomonas phaseoli pv. dieffenbachiae]
MTDHPASLPALQPQRAPADLLSQLLQLVRPRGDGAYTAHLGQHYAAAFAAGVSHLHYLERGTAWLIPAAGQPIPLVAGDVVVLPHGRGHRLCDDPRAPTSPVGMFDAAAFDRDSLRVRHGSGEQSASLIGALFRYERLPLPPIMRALPEVIRIPGNAGHVPEWLAQLSHFLMAEALQVQAGATLMVSRIIDLMVIRVLRSWVELEPLQASWLGSPAGARIGRALGAIHADAYRSWTVAELARRADMSRSSFAAQFTDIAGEPPIRYIARWRLTVADELIRSGGISVGDAARRVGYASEAGFSRAFKALFGYAPNTAKPLT